MTPSGQAQKAAWVLAAAGALLLLVAYEVASSGVLVRADVRLETFLEKWPPAVRTAIGLVASAPGEIAVAFILIAASMAILWSWGRPRLAVLVGAAGFAGELSAYLLKALFHRARATSVETDFSFPSGHAGRIVLDVGLILFFVVPQWRLRQPVRAAKWVPLLVPLWVTLVVVVDVGRVVGGYHFLSDALAGNALGAFLLSLALLSSSRIGADAPSTP